MARQVVEVLEAAGRTCWIAPRDIPPGAEFTSAILEALAEAPVVVLVFSTAANDSPHVRRELETTVGQDTPLLPVRIEDVEPSPSLRYFIGTSQWLDTVGVQPATWGPLLIAGIARAIGHPSAPVVDAPPPVLDVAVARPRLPPPTGTTWGRDALVAEVCDLLATDQVVTLTGLGGVGKTRVAAEVAVRVANLEIVDDAEPASCTGARPREAPRCSRRAESRWACRRARRAGAAARRRVCGRAVRRGRPNGQRRRSTSSARRPRRPDLRSARRHAARADAGGGPAAGRRAGPPARRARHQPGPRPRPRGRPGVVPGAARRTAALADPAAGDLLRSAVAGRDRGRGRAPGRDRPPDRAGRRGPRAGGRGPAGPRYSCPTRSG